MDLTLVNTGFLHEVKETNKNMILNIETKNAKDLLDVIGPPYYPYRDKIPNCKIIL
jgi:hypothetical protein